jgi:hypothetical protein
VLFFPPLIYRQLLSVLQSGGYYFQTFTDFIEKSKDKVVIIHHDVDRLPENAIRMVRLEHELGWLQPNTYELCRRIGMKGLFGRLLRWGMRLGINFKWNTNVRRVWRSVHFIRRGILLDGPDPLDKGPYISVGGI